MNFEKLFKDYQVDYSLKTNKGWVNTKCIFCGGSSYKLGFNPIEDYCTCFACGSHNLKETLSLILGVPKNQIKDVLEQYKGRTIVLDSLNKKKFTRIKLELPTDTFTKVERKYLIKRNFNPDFLHDKYKIVGGGITGRWKYRIIIPLIYQGKIISWTARSILSKEELDELKIPRYKNLSNDESIIDVKSILFNLDNCNKDSVILTEGPMDVIRGGDNVCCSFGTSITEEQIKLLAGRFRKIFILFDNEVEAQKKARKYGMELSSLGVDVEIIDAFSDYNKNDMGECSEQEIQEIKMELGI